MPTKPDTTTTALQGPSPTGRALELTRLVIDTAPTSADLCAQLNMSLRTMHRVLADARALGADIQPRRIPQAATAAVEYRWDCVNGTEIDNTGILNNWLRYEQTRQLIPH